MFEFYDCDVLLGREIDEDEETAATVDDAVAEMRRSGVARALVTNTKISLSTPLWGNDDLAASLAGHKEVRGIFGIQAVNERHEAPVAERVDALIKQGAAGVQLWPGREAWDFAPWQCPDLFDALSQRGLPAFMHNDSAQPQQVYDVLKAFPKLVLVYQRVFYGHARRILGLMRACPNLHLATSPGWVGGRVIEQFDSYFGSDRMLFGSGYARYDVMPAVAQIIYSEISDEKKSAIAGGNLRRLLEQIR